MHEELTNALTRNTDQLLDALSRFNDRSFYQKPATGGWSPAQVLEHLIIFDNRTLGLIDDATSPPGDQQEKFTLFRDRLADRVNKIDAPEALVPSNDPPERNILIETFRAKRQALADYTNNNDMSCLVKFSHRLFGPLTRFEWIQLTIQHSLRHIEQLQEIPA